MNKNTRTPKPISVICALTALLLAIASFVSCTEKPSGEASPSDLPPVSASADQSLNAQTAPSSHTEPPSEEYAIKDKTFAAAIEDIFGHMPDPDEIAAVKELDLSSRQLDDISDIALFTGLEKLNLYGNGTFEGAEALGKLTKLVELDASACGFNDIEWIRTCTSLKKLDLNWSNGAKDTMPLAALTELTELSMQYVQITNLAPIASLKNLTVLNITVQSIRDFSTLKELSGLRSLTVNYAQPANRAQFFEGIGAMSELTELHFNNLTLNYESDHPELYENLLKLKKLRVLEFSYFQGNYDESALDLSRLSGMEALEELSATYCSIYELSDPIDIPTLKKLNVSMNAIADISGISALTGLEELDISYNEISDISPLAPLKELKYLNLDILPIKSLKGLEDHNALKELIIRPSTDQVVEMDMSAIRGNSSLEMLDIFYVENVDYGIIGSLSSLKALYSSGKGKTPEALAGLKNLTKLDIYDAGFDDISFLAGLTELEELCLSYCNIGDVSPLAGLTKLRTLVLRDCGLTDIAPLEGLVLLETLQLDGNGITSCAPLAGFKNLVELDFRNNEIRDVSVLGELKNLKRLELSGNPLTVQKVDKLREKLPECSIGFSGSKKT